jgi:hypothetical protein
MTPLGGTILDMFFTENIALFQVFQGANPYFGAPDITPVSDDSTGHMLEIIVLEKGALQVIDDHIDGSVGSVPDPFVITSPGVSRFGSTRRPS